MLLENTVNAIVLAQFDGVYRTPDFRNGSNGDQPRPSGTRDMAAGRRKLTISVRQKTRMPPSWSSSLTEEDAMENPDNANNSTQPREPGTRVN